MGDAFLIQNIKQVPEPISFEFIGAFENQISAQGATRTYSFPAVEPGLIVITTASENTTNFSSLTLNGVAATKAVQATQTVTAISSAAIFYLKTTTNVTSASLAMNTSPARASIHIYRIVNNTNDVPHLIPNSSTGAGSTSTISNVSFPANSVGIAIRGDEAYRGSYVWSGLNKDFDNSAGSTSSGFTGASQLFATSTTSNISVSGTSSVGYALVAAVWK
jgi:hypothetical protein